MVTALSWLQVAAGLEVAFICITDIYRSEKQLRSVSTVVQIVERYDASTPFPDYAIDNTFCQSWRSKKLTLQNQSAYNN